MGLAFKVLIVFSGARSLSLEGGGTHPTGFFLSELTDMTDVLKKDGYELIYATPNGKRPALAPESDSLQWFSSPREYEKAKDFVRLEAGLEHPRAFGSFTEDELATFAGIFAPGGYAPMEDLPTNKELGALFVHFHRHGKATAAVCHGPIALLSTRQTDKPWIYAGYDMTIVSKAEEQEEEVAGHLGGRQLYYVEDALRHAGANVKNAKPWQPHVVKDRELITGQNPMSAKLISREFAALLKSQK